MDLITEFRHNNGKLGGMFAGWHLIVLTTTGARSNQPRSSLLGHLEIDGNEVVVASAMGAPRHPAWYHNIRKNPLVTVETGTETYRAMAAIPPAGERDALFARVLEEAPGFADHQARTTRVLPVVVLHKLKPVKGMGDWIVEVHDWLRANLADLRRRLDAGETPESFVDCRQFCTALARHHTGEDGVMFPSLSGRFPALAPALAELGREHAQIALIQKEIQHLLETDHARLREELERLTAELEAHFAREEATIVQALNATADYPVTFSG